VRGLSGFLGLCAAGVAGVVCFCPVAVFGFFATAEGLLGIEGDLFCPLGEVGEEDFGGESALRLETEIGFTC
jgi:hypothetical protein